MLTDMKVNRWEHFGLAVRSYVGWVLRGFPPYWKKLFEYHWNAYKTGKVQREQSGLESPWL